MKLHVGALSTLILIWVVGEGYKKTFFHLRKLSFLLDEEGLVGDGQGISVYGGLSKVFRDRLRSPSCGAFMNGLQKLFLSSSFLTFVFWTKLGSGILVNIDITDC